MLDNLTKSEGIPSSELIRDLRTLCGLGTEELAKVTDAFASLPDEPTQGAISETLLAKLRNLRTDPEKLRGVLEVTVFLWRQWARLGLTKDQVLADLHSLDVDQQALTDVSPLLDAMSQKLGGFQRQKAESLALQIGTPRIDSAVCVVDARALFKSSEYEEDLGEQQPYFEFDYFLPIVVLEIVSDLNDEKTTQSYLLTEKILNQLCDILVRAKKRLQVVQTQISAVQDRDDGSAGQNK